MRHVLYFTADWCNPCKKVRPIVEEINKDSITKFLFIDIDTELSLAQDYEVRSIPTFILLEDGKEIKRVSGAQTQEQLMGLINHEQNTKNDIQS
jgi:thioredoxin-like negative regulator of GroEL